MIKQKSKRGTFAVRIDRQLMNEARRLKIDVNKLIEELLTRVLTTWKSKT